MADSKHSGTNPSEDRNPFLSVEPLTGYPDTSDNVTLMKDVDRATSEKDVLRYLTDESLISRGPLVFILVLMMLIGVVVNSVVTMVFLKRFPGSALRTYIVTMSVSDLVATTVGITLNIYNLLTVYNFRHVWLCRVLFTVISLSTNTSSFIIVLLAWDRLRRMLNPSFQDTDRQNSYYHVALVLLLSLAVTVPFVPLHGVYSVSTQYGSKAKLCWVDDQYKDSTYRTVFSVVLGITFYSCMSIVGASYAKIGYKIYVLTSGIKAEVLELIENPPPPNRFLFIYDDEYFARIHQISVEELPAITSAVAEKYAAENKQEPTDSIKISSFAERLHTPRPHMLETSSGRLDPFQQRISLSSRRMTNKKSIQQRMSVQQHKIKKFSTALQAFFNPEESSKSSVENDSSFISQRGFGSFGKTSYAPGTKKSESSKTTAKVPKTPKQKREGPSDPKLSESYIAMSNRSAPKVRIRQSMVHSSSSSHSLININLNMNANSKDTKSNLSQSGTLPTDSMVTRRQTGSDDAKPGSDLPQAAAEAPPAAEKKSVEEPAEEPKDCTSYPHQTRTADLAEEQQEQMREEAFFTLEHLKRIRTSSRNTMITLTVTFFITWAPNFLARVITQEPLYLCKDLTDCWSNIGGYAFNSVFINSTVNAFFYCFGSVHFRKHVRLFFKPLKDKICPKKKKKKIIRGAKKALPKAPK